MRTAITTWLSHPETGPDEEREFGPSQTQPDMAMSLETLLRRHTQGKEITTYEPSWSDDTEEYFPDPESMDLVELHELRERTAQYIEHLDSRYRKYQTPEGKPQTSEGLNTQPEPTKADPE